jgi:ABC-type nitrate/sulfonate/bicarbonate transport system substrate-binding protein
MSDSVAAMFNVKQKFAVVIFFAAFWLSAWCHAQELKPIRVSLSLGPGQLGLWVARDAGLFAKYGLNAELVGLQSAPRQIQLLLSGETLFASTSGTAPMRARIEGADTIFTMGVLNSFTLSVVAVPEIKDARDLKGKILGVGSLASSPENLARRWLRQIGIERDVKILSTGGYIESLAAMERRQIHAAVLDPPRAYIGRKNFNFRTLVNLAEQFKYLTTATITTAANIRKNRELILRFTKAYIEGIHRVKTDKEFAINVLGKALRASDRDALEETYRVFSTLFEKVPYPAPEGIESVLEELRGQTPKANNLRPEDFVDSSFVRELEKSGFINRLYL